ncbi:MAG: CHC2 zinc finger domain-containing protein [Taibaiella sp.]|jgi:hypothetical protein
MKNLSNKTTSRLGAPVAKLTSNKKNYTTKFNGEFNPSRLPMPIIVLDIFGEKVKKANRGGYWKVHCPFHDDSNPSLHIHQVSGHFRCHACGAKSGNILAYYMKKTGESFVEAAKSLGAWEIKS